MTTIMIPTFVLTFFLLFTSIQSLPYFDEWVDYNLNQNKNAKSPAEYWGQWEGHTFTPSPDNWRMPFYTIFLDRLVNGDPTNDDINGTHFEVDPLQSQLRAGGDIAGLVDSLDYLQGMGIKGLYLAGSPFMNQPWAADSYSPLDMTLLDWHFGNISAWRTAIDEIHRRGMYVILDNTMSTMGDLIGFEGYLNTTTPFSFTEHRAVWKTSRRYWDFQVSEDVVENCEYPRFWDELGNRIGSNVTSHMTQCLSSDFDQYGDVASFGNYPEWQKQLSKFGFVQDRLREWRPSVLDKIKLFSCITINMLDIDGFRIDKGLTVTVDAQASWSDYIRQCAKKVGKENFFIPGEIVAGNALAALYLGRGKEPQMTFTDENEVFNATNSTDASLYIRNTSALDAAAFHYSVYRSLSRFLGLDGVFGAEADIRVNWAEGWQDILMTNDLININTGSFDPRHLFGVSNQDVFRWPAIKNGTQKGLVGFFVTTMLLPGIPILTWGEEQAMYVLENTAGNYLFGRQPLSSTVAWQLHGCYKVGSEKYTDFPLDSALYGCEDYNVSLDHRDPSHPLRNILRRFYEIRAHYPTLNDGFELRQLSNKTHEIFLRGSKGTPTELGIWSHVRMRRAGIQDFTNQGAGNQMVWLLSGNENATSTYTFDCNNATDALIAPFDAGTTVKNLLYPYEEFTLVASPVKLGLENSTGNNGCLQKISIDAWGFKALVPKAQFIAPAPVVTKFLPGHDFRYEVDSTTPVSVPVEIHFSQEMDCDSVRNAISIHSRTGDGSTARLNAGSVKCQTIQAESTTLSGEVAGLWVFNATLDNVSNGVHEITVSNATTQSKNGTTGSTDHFLLRVGMLDNPMVFPRLANYSTQLAHKVGGKLIVQHRASGADRFRCSQDWGSHWTDWQTYTGENFTMPKRIWTGTDAQNWRGDHVTCQYWSRLTGSSHHVQEGDADPHMVMRRFPHLFVHGSFNEFGFDAGLPAAMTQNKSSHWLFDFMAEWPTNFQFNVWGMNPDGIPDTTEIYGDVDGDFILDRIPPASLVQNVVNLTKPPLPYVAWRLTVDDRKLSYSISPTGSASAQIALFALLWIMPTITAIAVIYIFMKSFYGVKFNEFGAAMKQRPFIPLVMRKEKRVSSLAEKNAVLSVPPSTRSSANVGVGELEHSQTWQQDAGGKRRSVLIATMEYDIEDWAIKIKIGGLGVMAQLMGKSLGHQDLIWVVPCVGGIDYPMDTPAEPMLIEVMGKTYKINVQYHTLRNITYVLLDAPVFRQQSKNEPYPARMDDLDSAIYYSAWNQCIAEAIKRFPVDLYHINDYHGAIAPLYLLPDVIPTCLSLHNAEFQGLWPMRNEKECKEVCSVFNLDTEVAKRYVQFGEVFNLLHAGASYLREHQKGFGAVGVSKKYGKRSYARYPIFWGLKEVQALPNPDPSDTADWNRNADPSANVVVDQAYEAERAVLRRQAQEWAGLEQDGSAELFVFVGRWSMQKGVDLIADVFPSVLENYPKAQLVCIGPVIDLYGKFAALKLEKLMHMYPGRVFSKPEFTQLPPYLFSGAEFALIPSRDEPFGLVAVEFGRKGALGVGSRVGGLGQMPGWWFTVESMTTKHLLQQFKSAIHDALSSSQETRALMRARSAKQRFPVAQWVEDLNKLQSTAIQISTEQHGKSRGHKTPSLFNLSRSRPSSPNASQLDISWPLHQASTPAQLSTPHLGPEHALLSPQPPFANPGSAQRSRSGSMASTRSVDILDPNAEHANDTGLGIDIYSPADTRRFSNLSLNSVIGGRTDFELQKVDPFFNDSNGHYYKEFEKKLEDLKAKNSESDFCIEDYLVKSEKRWFENFKREKAGLVSSRNVSSTSLAKMARERVRSPGPSGLASSAGSIRDAGRNRYSDRSDPSSYNENSYFNYDDDDDISTIGSENSDESFHLGQGYVHPTGLKQFMLRKVFTWPIYSLFLAFGQIIAANSYQITLLTGEIGQSATMLYVIATIYAATSVLWWLCFRRLPSVYCLSIPFVFYGLAFTFVGFAPFVRDFTTRGWIQHIASGWYAVASSSGSLYFALNFGDEGGAPVKEWVLRACIIQGTQQIYVSALWFWGSALTKLSNAGTQISGVQSGLVITCVCLPIAVLMFVVSALVYFGLPTYYRQQPGSVPSFYKSIFRRKIILWFFIAVLMQNYWLSSPYGRNWHFLWSSSHASAWQILILVAFFFVGAWALSLWVLGRLSKAHSWILPIFAIGLGAPRWAQMLWGISGSASYLPWTGNAMASALLARGLWLWLGVLDALQGVGFGMILLQTMTRFHNTFTLIAAQVLGSIATILGRATAPDRVGPGNVFPNFALGAGGLASASFWICLLMQLSICVGFATFFRKEQLSKP